MVAPIAAGRHRPVVRVAWLAAWLAAATVVAAALGDVGSVLIPGSGDWRERRLARRIVAAGRRNA
jgi:hypothetical protein